MPGLDTTFLNNVTREHFIPGTRNQLYDEMPLMKDILQNGVETAIGRSLIDDVILARAAAHGTWTGYNPISTQESNPVVQAALNYANYYASVSISLDEEKRNSGNKEKLLDMLEVKFNNAKSTLKEDVYKDLFLALTSRNGDNTIVGLAAMISASNTYANINRSTTGNEGWQSNIFSTACTDAQLKDPTSGSKYLPTVMRTEWLAAAHDKVPTVGITTTALYEIYQYIGETHNLRFDASEVNLMFGDGKDGAKLGRKFTLRWDKYCTAKSMFFLTPEDFKAFIFPDANFDGYDDGTGMWQRGQNQFAKSMQIIWMGQIICRVPREQAVANNLGG